MTEENRHPSEQVEKCSCLSMPQGFLVIDKELGMDVRFAEVTLLTCPVCGQMWLRYFYENEAFTASGRWYLGAITAQQASLLAAENAKEMLESQVWYFYGGSFYGGRTGKTSGKVFLNP